MSREEPESNEGSFGSRLKGFFSKNQGKLDAVGKSLSSFWKDLTSESSSLGSLVSGSWRGDNFTAEELGITYITKRLLLMGFPGEEETSMGRPIDYLSHYLDTHHRDQYMVWNLSERQYDTSKFHNQVIEFSFPGYPAPPLHRTFEIVKSIAAWLDADPTNVAVVHCQTGTGRSAVSVASYLAFLGYQSGDCSRCLEMIAMACGIPVTSLVIPTQRRYLNYVTNLLAGNYPASAPIVLERVIINTVPDFERGGCRPYLQIFKHAKLVFTSVGREKALRWYAQEDAAMLFPIGLPLEGDIIIRVRHLTARNERVSMFRCGFHAGFVRPGSVRFPVVELDSACADDRFGDQFWVDLVFRALRPGEDPMATAKAAAVSMLATQPDGASQEDERAKAVTNAAAAAGKSTSLVGAGLEASEIASIDTRQYWARLIRNTHSATSQSQSAVESKQEDADTEANVAAAAMITPVKPTRSTSATPNSAARAAALAAIRNSPEPPSALGAAAARRESTSGVQQQQQQVESAAAPASLLSSATVSSQAEGTEAEASTKTDTTDDNETRHIRFRFDSDDEDGEYLAPVPVVASPAAVTKPSGSATTSAGATSKTDAKSAPAAASTASSSSTSSDLNAMLANLSEELGLDLTGTGATGSTSALHTTTTSGAGSGNGKAGSSTGTAEEKSADAMLADILGSIEGLDADDVLQIALRGNANETAADANVENADELLKSLNLGDELP